MPYVITTKNTLDHAADVDGLLHPIAVATLDEARAAIRAAIDHARDDMRGWRDEAHAWTDARTFLGINIEIGGSIGPLPDGTVIEVRRMDWDQLALAVGGDVARELFGNSARQILAAFNR